jgi:hypothetical protein
MNVSKTILTAVLLASGCTGAMAQISTSNPIANNGAGNPGGNGPHQLTNEATSKTGTIIRKDLVWTSNIPLNKKYGEFTAEERADLHAMYEAMPEGDEPPFPIDGLRPIFNSIKKGQQIVRARGTLNMVVTVGPDGKATEVADMGGITGVNALEMQRYAGSVLLMTKYKPAICGGKPCKSQFPFVLDLKLR